MTLQLALLDHLNMPYSCYDLRKMEDFVQAAAFPTWTERAATYASRSHVSNDRRHVEPLVEACAIQTNLARELLHHHGLERLLFDHVGHEHLDAVAVRISHLFLCERVVLLHLRSGRDQRRSLALALDVIEQRLVDQEVVLSDADLLQVSRRDGVLERSERRWWLQITEHRIEGVRRRGSLLKRILHHWHRRARCHPLRQRCS
mmetsp:Transcript_8149/g.24425  ORF Transcript_8149/g.24425 Transcript_8149/m.24425 type:complete len:203 (+) Transcript_8149:170-778(+)